jgi:hypothetical protein
MFCPRDKGERILSAEPPISAGAFVSLQLRQISMLAKNIVLFDRSIKVFSLGALYPPVRNL